MKTDIRVGSLLPRTGKISKLLYSKVKDLLPENYNLHTDPKYEGRLTKVLDQRVCGGCYSYAISSSLSDMFVITGITKYSPNISPTSIMSLTLDKVSENVDICDGCNGGIIALIVNYISGQNTDSKQIYLYSENCIGTEWCDNDKICNPPPNTVGPSEVDNVDLPFPYCISDKKNKLGYTIAYSDDAERPTPHTTDNIDEIKAHIYISGPVVAGIPIYMGFFNFFQGDFKNVNEGVFIETVGPDGSIDDKNLGDMDGGHALSIVGWGITQNEYAYDPSNPNKKRRIPYWWVKNSWGTEWGMNPDGSVKEKDDDDYYKGNGFFKIAMYFVDEDGYKINPNMSFTNPSNPNLPILFYPDPNIIPLPDDYYPKTEVLKSNNVPIAEACPENNYCPKTLNMIDINPYITKEGNILSKYLDEDNTNFRNIPLVIPKSDTNTKPTVSSSSNKTRNIIIIGIVVAILLGLIIAFKKIKY